MKNFFSILFLFIFLSPLYTQNNPLKSQYEVIYRYNGLNDSLSRSSQVEEDLSLLINGNVSVFKSTKKALSDSLALEIGNKSFDNPVDGKVILDMRNVPTVAFKSEVFLENGKQTIFKMLMKNSFSFPLEDPIQWNIEDERKKIGDYSCKKATGKYKNRSYIAWFTESIPIPDGPYVFKGLPGLVLEVYDVSNYNSFSMVSFKKVEKPIIPIKNSIPTKYASFYEARKNLLDNPAGLLKSQTGISVSNPNAMEMKTRMNKGNNFID